jgi:predicted O-methyltransferase YrrM
MSLLNNARRARRFLDRLPVILSAPRPSRSPQALATLFPEVPPATLAALRMDLIRNNTYYAELDEAMIAVRNRRVIWHEYVPMLYVAVRVLRPKVVIETGVFDGVSSSALLQAMHDNTEGVLESIDLPATAVIVGATDAMPETSLPPGRQPGWLVPQRLRERYSLRLGDSREILPRVLGEHKTIDIFFHDSLHTDAHMTFEFQTAWPHLRDGGLMASDDVLFNRAFMRLTRALGKSYVLVDGCGAFRK